MYSMLTYLEAHPTGRCIVTMRDGRDVVCSLMRRGMGFDAALKRWVWSAKLAREALSDHRVMLINYDDLVTNTQAVLARLLDFIGLDAGIDDMLAMRSSRLTDDPSIAMGSWSLRPTDTISTTPIGRWRSTLTREQAQAFEAEDVAELMRWFGCL